MKKFKTWVKWVALILVIASITVIVWLILRNFGITSVKGLRNHVLKAGVWGFAVFLILQIMVTSLLCFLPATSMTFIIVAVLLFGAWKGFIISTIGVIISSMVMFFIGRYGGEKLAKKLVGEESLQKAQELMKYKSKIYLPLMFLLPVFPDDALCMVAGITKMKWWEFLIITIICRTIGVAATCFLGSNYIKWGELSIIDWFVFISVCLIDIYIIIKCASKLEKKIKDKKEKQE